MRASKGALENTPVPIKIKLSALWASLMFCYIYGDYFGLYRPGTLKSMLDGQMGPLGPTTQGVLLATALLMAVPSLMVILCLVLPPAINRIANIVLGLAYAAIMLMSMPGAWHFYLVLGCIEVALSLLTVWYALRWPRQPAL
ncbi:DUF6326 family protein [Dyella sp. ASV21]|uniref:DUF6326 family protein n=1 Tax=Dyella sp. ASV21 TaxID=2795114 RepID=UPI0018EB511E|nr:DUF6326 family protein [Dyella sp. ASV21]